MWPFSTKSKLLRELDRLAIYNDKGAIYGNHPPSKIDAIRKDKIARIESFVQQMEVDSLPPKFLLALKSGELAKDSCGEYFDLVKNNEVKKGAI